MNSGLTNNTVKFRFRFFQNVLILYISRLKKTCLDIYTFRFSKFINGSIQLNIMFNPFSVTGAVDDAKKNRSLGKSVVVNVIAGVLVLVGLVITFAVNPLLGAVGGAVTGVIAGVGAIIGLLVGELILGWVYSLAVGVIGGKGSLYEGFTALTYPTYVLALGWLVASVLGLIPLVGPLLALLVGLIFGAIGVATFFRVTKDLFALDYVATLVAVGVLVLALSVAGVFAAGTAFTQLGGLLGSTGGLTGAGAANPLAGLGGLGALNLPTGY